MTEREAKELKKEIDRIKERNKRVELDKAWETSWQRKVLIFILTYLVILVFFIFAQLPNPLVNSIVPAVAFVLSTLTLSFFKEMWLKLKKLKKPKK
ncbi:MAG TPA: hypothetical protein VJA86_01745 [Candidatus Nanoarchaeia archaeon]|nr:hypothetical protein [Candidatus Nanoarchaeia archaeon]